MKKVFIVLLAVLLICPCLAFGESSDLTWYFPSDMSDADLRQLRDMINVELSKRASGTEGALASVVLSDCLVEVLSIEKTATYQNEPAMIVAFRFVNNSSSATTVNRTIDPLMFQNGVQINSIATIPDVEFGYLKEIKPGGSIVAYYAFLLLDETSPVDLEVRRRVSPFDAALMLTHILDK